MNKKEFINKLSSYLGGIPAEDKKDVIGDFEEHFKEGIADGRKEEDIAEALGDPRVLANQFKASILVYQAEKTTSPLNITRAVFATLGLGFFNLIFVLGPFVVTVCVLIALFACAVALAAAGITVFFGTIFGPLFPQYVSTLINPAAAIFGSAGVTCLGILFFIGDMYLGKLFYKLFLKYIKFNIRIITGRE
jgi:uncharacterized membrane protein